MTMTGSKIFFEFDPFEKLGIEKPKSGSRNIKKEMADFLREEILSYVGDGRSPVSGGGWKKSLSKDYKKYKSQFSSELFANMELKGDMLDAFDVVVNRAGNIEVRVSGTKQAAKADGHNNHSGKSSLPERKFIPSDDEFFKRDITSGLKEIAKEFMDE